MECLVDLGIFDNKFSAYDPIHFYDEVAQLVLRRGMIGERLKSNMLIKLLTMWKLIVSDKTSYDCKIS